MNNDEFLNGPNCDSAVDRRLSYRIKKKSSFLQEKVSPKLLKAAENQKIDNTSLQVPVLTF